MERGLTDKETIGKLLRKNKRLERELSRIETVFNAINSAIIVAGPDGEIRFANSFASRILGLGENPQSLFKILPCMEDAVSEVMENDSAIRREFCITYPEARTLSAQIVPFDFGAEGETFAIIINDVTEVKQDTEERIECEKIDSVLKLASGIAHELGNPLNSINIHLQLVKRRLAKIAGSAEAVGEIRSSVDICSDEVTRLDGIIENFLKALRPMRPDMRECDPLKSLAETLRLLNGELENLKIEVFVSSEKSLPKVYADENLLKQLYFNILRNAMEAMDGGGKISITAVGDDDNVKISFADTGCGISEEGVSKLFEPYYTTKPDGHGLGMTIIRAIVRAHNGRLDVDSKQGRGTTISVFIPRSEKVVRMLPQTSGK